jgi:hypothetical protein
LSPSSLSACSGFDCGLQLVHLPAKRFIITRVDHVNHFGTVSDAFSV